jgi:hypothetical protein
VPVDDIPELLGRLRAIEARLVRRLDQAVPAARTESVPSSPEAWLTADEVAARLRRTRTWVYRQARHWPFAKRPSRKTLLISERGLSSWLQRR